MRRKKRVKVTTPTETLTFSEQIPSIARAGIWQPRRPPAPELVKELMQQIDELLTKHKRTVIPTELRVELKAFTQMATEAIELKNAIVDRVRFEPELILASELMLKVNELEKHIRDLVTRIR